MGGDVVACQALRRSRQPCFYDQLPQFVERDALQTHKHGGVAVEMWGGEVDVGRVGDQSVFGLEVLDPGPEDRTLGRRIAEGSQVGLTQRTFPDEPLVVHMPTLAAVYEALVGVRQREGDSPDVVPG